MSQSISVALVNFQRLLTVILSLLEQSGKPAIWRWLVFLVSHFVALHCSGDFHSELSSQLNSDFCANNRDQRIVLIAQLFCNWPPMPVFLILKRWRKNATQYCYVQYGNRQWNESCLIVYPIHIKVVKKYVFPECIIVKAGETDVPNVNLHHY